MKIRKRYRALRSYKLNVCATIGERNVVLEFGGADRYHDVKGCFSTSDEKVQKFLEESPMFNRDYCLEESKVVKEYVPKSTSDGDSRVEMKKMKFRLMSDAKFFIETTLGLKSSKYTSKQKCIEVCKDHGYEIEFEER